MAIEFNIGADQFWFLGEDKVLRFTIYDADGETPIDITGWALSFSLRKTDKDATVPALIAKTTEDDTIEIVGTFNIDPEVNTQSVEIQFPSFDTTNLKPIAYRYSLKRMDAGFEGILAYGSITLLQATEH